jgi:membrane-associated phospholipid phosphatase
VRYAFASLSCCFAALAVAVAAGVFTGLDEWAVNHLMPGANFQGHATTIGAIVPLYGTKWHAPWSVAANVVTLPASFVIALALTAWRSRPLAVVVVVATGVEFVTKHLLERPALFHHGRHVLFDDSFPSGHSLRAVLVAAAFAQPWAAIWAAAAVALLEAAGWHTPTDIAGGIVLGALGLLCARRLGGRRLARGRA